MMPHALAKTHALAPGCDEECCAAFAKAYLAARTGCALPESRQESLPGAGGRAAQAGATRQAGWDYKNRQFAPGRSGAVGGSAPGVACPSGAGECTQEHSQEAREEKRRHACPRSPDLAGGAALASQRPAHALADCNRPEGVSASLAKRTHG